MGTEMGLFGGNKALANSDLFAKARKLNKTLTGGGGGIPRISLRGGRFRQYEGGEQVQVSKDDAMNIVVVNAAPLSRQYYKGTYNPDKPEPPACWSHDTKVPAPDVKEPMAPNCLNCPMNVKGSGQGESRACRFSQRMAVVIEGNYEKVYQLSIAATSIFGEAEQGNMPMNAYAKMLEANDAPIQAVVTEMSFDENSDTPKLFFKPVRPLEEDEFEKVMQQAESDAAKKAMELTVAQADGVQSVEADAKPAVEEPTAEAAPAAEPEPEEPKKRDNGNAEKKAAEDADDIAAILDDWDDEE